MELREHQHIDLCPQRFRRVDRVVAHRGDLPGLPAQLRRRQRRRHRRPRRGAVAAALPELARRRRHLVHPLVLLTAGRRRVRRRRLPGDRPGVRHPGGGRVADRGGRRAGHPHDRRHRAEPRVRPARVVPRRTGRRAGIARAATVLVPRGPGARRVAAADGLDLQLLRRHLDPDDERRRHARRVVPAPVRPAAARPELEPPGRAARARGRAAVLVRPRGRGHPDRLGDHAGQGRQLPGARRRARSRRAPVRRPRRAARHLPRLARGRGLLRGAEDARRRDLAGRPPAVRPLPAPRRDAHGVQLRLHDAPVGPRAAARVHPDHCGRPPPGRRGADVDAVQPRRHPARDPVRPRGQLVRLRRAAVRHPDRPGHRAAPGTGRGPADRRAAGVPLPVPGRRARPARGRGPAARRAPGPDVLPVRGRRPRSRRLPRAAAVDRVRTDLRVR